jgi:hypothetical protein
MLQQFSITEFCKKTIMLLLFKLIVALFYCFSFEVDMSIHKTDLAWHYGDSEF